MSAQRTSYKTRSTRIPKTRFGWAILVAAAILLSSTAAYAMSPLLRQLFLNSDAGLSHVEQLNLGQELDLTQTTSGFEVNVSRVYADANRIVVGYTVNGPSLTNNFAMSLSLMDEGGGVSQLSEERSTATKNGIRAFIASFDATGIRDTPSKLRLSMEPGQAPSVTDSMAERTWHSLGTPVTFDLNVDAKIDRRISDLRQTDQASGVTLVLEQVRISPTSVNAILCDATTYTEGEAPYWLSAGVLDTERGTNERVQSEASAMSIEGCHTLKFPAPHYYSQSGNWTLTVHELTAPDHIQGNDKKVTGTWTFQFSSP